MTEEIKFYEECIKKVNREGAIETLVSLRKARTDMEREAGLNPGDLKVSIFGTFEEVPKDFLIGFSVGVAHVINMVRKVSERQTGPKRTFETLELSLLTFTSALTESLLEKLLESLPAKNS